jgi:hypothetical protein
MPPLLAMVDFNNSGSESSEGTLVSVLQQKKPALVAAQAAEAEAEAAASSSPTKKTKKKVHFKGSVKVRKISSHNNFSAEEKANVWFSRDECKLIRASAVKTVKKLVKGIDVDKDPTDCSRGLEFKTPQKNKIRQTRKLDVIWSVLGTQEELQEEGVVDDEKIAYVYSAFTLKCANEACKRGLKDAMAAREP